ncbi:hypothetical protein QOT17_019813 [Balamuthia mandrillaris]
MFGGGEGWWGFAYQTPASGSTSTHDLQSIPNLTDLSRHHLQRHPQPPPPPSSTDAPSRTLLINDHNAMTPHQSASPHQLNSRDVSFVEQHYPPHSSSMPTTPLSTMPDGRLHPHPRHHSSPAQLQRPLHPQHPPTGSAAAARGYGSLSGPSSSSWMERETHSMDAAPLRNYGLPIVESETQLFHEEEDNEYTFACDQAVEIAHQVIQLAALAKNRRLTAAQCSSMEKQMEELEHCVQTIVSPILNPFSSSFKTEMKPRDSAPYCSTKETLELRTKLIRAQQSLQKQRTNPSTSTTASTITSANKTKHRRKRQSSAERERRKSSANNSPTLYSPSSPSEQTPQQPMLITSTRRDSSSSEHHKSNKNNKSTFYLRWKSYSVGEGPSSPTSLSSSQTGSNNSTSKGKRKSSRGEYRNEGIVNLPSSSSSSRQSSSLSNVFEEEAEDRCSSPFAEANEEVYSTAPTERTDRRVRRRRSPIISSTFDGGDEANSEQDEQTTRRNHVEQRFSRPITPEKERLTIDYLLNHDSSSSSSSFDPSAASSTNH